MTTWLAIIIGIATAIVLISFGILIGVVLADRDIVESEKIKEVAKKAGNKVKKVTKKRKPAHISKIDNERVSNLREKKLKKIPDFLIDKNGQVH